jgi:hypothetical protein
MRPSDEIQTPTRRSSRFWRAPAAAADLGVGSRVEHPGGAAPPALLDKRLRERQASVRKWRPKTGVKLYRGKGISNQRLLRPDGVVRSDKGKRLHATRCLRDLSLPGEIANLRTRPGHQGAPPRRWASTEAGAPYRVPGANTSLKPRCRGRYRRSPEDRIGTAPIKGIKGDKELCRGSFRHDDDGLHELANICFAWILLKPGGLASRRYRCDIDS